MHLMKYGHEKRGIDAIHATEKWVVYFNMYIN